MTIAAGRVIHDGSPGLTDQLLSAVPRQTDTGWRLSKGKSKRKIDAAIALVMALDRATVKVGAAPLALLGIRGVTPSALPRLPAADPDRVTLSPLRGRPRGALGPPGLEGGP